MVEVCRWYVRHLAPQWSRAWVIPQPHQQPTHHFKVHQRGGGERLHPLPGCLGQQKRLPTLCDGVPQPPPTSTTLHPTVPEGLGTQDWLGWKLKNRGDLEAPSRLPGEQLPKDTHQTKFSNAPSIKQHHQNHTPKTKRLRARNSSSYRMWRMSGRIAVPLGVKTVFRSANTLRQTLFDVKNRTPHEMKKGVVYEVPCADCGHVHIGETGQNPKKRLKEHDYAVRRGDLKNGRAVHAWENDNRVEWEAAKVRLVEQNLRKRKVLKDGLSSNLDCRLRAWSGSPS